MADLSAGLSYSVMKNCLNKVLRISDYSELGESVVVQGGTFRNISVFRSLELLSSVKVSSSDNPELMGAYGAGLHAMDKAAAEEPGSGFVGVENLAEAVNFTTQSIIIKVTALRLFGCSKSNFSIHFLPIWFVPPGDTYSLGQTGVKT